jgi:alpha-amylase
MGQRIWVVGNHPALGNWELAATPKMKWHPGHIWKVAVEVEVPPEQLKYKAVLKKADGSLRWEVVGERTACLTGCTEMEAFTSFDG